MTFNRWPRALIAIAAALALAGCQGTGSSTPSPASTAASSVPGASPDASSSGSAAPGTDLAAVEAKIQTYLAIPEFTPPGPAFDASKAAGKKIFFVPNTTEIPFVVALQEAFESIAQASGVEVIVWPTKGEQTQWVQGMNQAIAQRADLVILAAPPQVLEPQLAEVKAAGIPVVVLHQYDKVMTIPDTVTAVAYAPFTDAARLMADWAIVDTDGKANVLVLTANVSPPSEPMGEAIEDELKTYCPDCKATLIDVPPAEWGSRMQLEVQSALLRDPSINYILPLFDSAAQFVVPGIEAAGRTDVHVATFNITPFVLEMIQTGDVVRMDTGENIAWIAYANMDQALRILSGEPPLTDASAPLRVFTDENIADVGTPPAIEKGFGDAFADGYLSLWGLAN